MTLEEFRARERGETASVKNTSSVPKGAEDVDACGETSQEKEVTEKIYEKKCEKSDKKKKSFD